MDRRGRKRKSDNQNNVIKLKHKYWTKVFSDAVNILKKEFDDDILTIKYVAKKHKSHLRQINSKYNHEQQFPSSNLSFVDYENFISAIAKQIMIEIKSELEDTIYFSITIDSVPDTDNSAIYIQYVNDGGIPIKHFLDMINKKADNALQIMDIVHIILQKYNLNHVGFMGLSYNINSSIPKYRDSLNASLKVINEYATIVPCSRDPLSSVIIKIASSCYNGNAFFTTIDELFNFFLLFQYQWDDIKYVLQNLSYAQFSSKNKTIQCLSKNWSTIVNALFQISENKSFVERIRIKAYLVLLKVKRLETCFLTMFWEDIVEQITEFEENLFIHVSDEINYHEVFKIYESSICFLNDFRTNEKFNDYRTRAFEKSNILHFNNKIRTEKPQMRFPVNYLDENDQFKIKTYFYMIDEIIAELHYRKGIYRELALKFNFLNQFTTRTDHELYKQLEYLQGKYVDLTYHISTECNDLKCILNKIQLIPTTIKDVSHFIRQKEFKFFFEELVKVVKMALCISATHCNVQHSNPSALKEILNSIGSITDEDTYKSLLFINMEPQLLTCLDFTSIVEDFTRRQLTE